MLSRRTCAGPSTGSLNTPVKTVRPRQVTSFGRPTLTDRSVPTTAVCASASDAYQLLVDELVHAEAAELAPEAGGLHPAERELDALRADRVDEDHAGLDLVGDAQRLLFVGRVHVRAQAVRRVVGEAHGLLLGAHLVDLRDRAEEL